MPIQLENKFQKNPYLQVDVKPTSPFIHPHTLGRVRKYTLFVYMILYNKEALCVFYQGIPPCLWKAKTSVPARGCLIELQISEDLYWVCIPRMSGDP